jgi:xanthine dehydrogenase molybdopterin-binding subunit B
MFYIETLSFQLSSQVQVEIDLLTGAITLLRADLMYVCGKSLNPAVDLG